VTCQELADEKGLEEFQTNFGGQATLVELQVQASSDHTATRVIDPFAEQVAT
jgi:hypothetical protein